MTVKNEEYKRAQLKITEFDAEDCITTSAAYGQDKYETPGVTDSDW